MTKADLIAAKAAIESGDMRAIEDFVLSLTSEEQERILDLGTTGTGPEHGSHLTGAPLIDKMIEEKWYE